MLHCDLGYFALHVNISLLHSYLRQHLLLSHLQELHALTDEAENSLLMKRVMHAAQTKMSEQQFNEVRCDCFSSHRGKQLHQMKQIVKQVITLILSCKLSISFSKERHNPSLTQIAETDSHFSLFTSQMDQQVEHSRRMFDTLQIHKDTPHHSLSHTFSMRLACDCQHDDPIKLRNLAVLRYRQLKDGSNDVSIGQQCLPDLPSLLLIDHPDQYIEHSSYLILILLGAAILLAQVLQESLQLVPAFRRRSEERRRQGVEMIGEANYIAIEFYLTIIFLVIEKKEEMRVGWCQERVWGWG